MTLKAGAGPWLGGTLPKLSRAGMSEGDMLNVTALEDSSDVIALTRSSGLSGFFSSSIAAVRCSSWAEDWQLRF
jgi:hypothetical protein